MPFGTSPLRRLKSRRLQCDEIWSFVDAKETRVIDLVQFTDDSAIDPIYVDRAST